MGRYLFKKSWRQVLAIIGIAAALGVPTIPGSELFGETIESVETSGPGLSTDTTTRLTAVIVDAATGDTLHARCNVVDCYNATHFPPAGTTFNYTSRGGYFYTEGVFDVEVRGIHVAMWRTNEPWPDSVQTQWSPTRQSILPEGER